MTDLEPLDAPRYSQAPLDVGLPRMLAAHHLGRRLDTSMWVHHGPIELYLRVGKRLIEGQMMLCVQIGNISLPPGRLRRGHFAAALAVLYRLTDLPIFLENVHNHSFATRLIERRGFRCVAQQGWAQHLLHDRVFVDLDRPADHSC